MTENIVLKVNEVCAILKIHRSKVYLLIESGALEAFKVGSGWRIKRSSVERLL